MHRARLVDGREVVLKVRRPGIRPTVEADLHLLARLAEIIDAEAPDLRRYRPREVVREFTLSLRRELDFAAECRNAERIAARFVDQPQIVMTVVRDPALAGLRTFGLLGFIGAAIGGIWVLLSIWRGPRG